MKYIRTKEELGIEREDGVCCFRTWVANADSPLKKDWLYADTIEELCDEFVIADVEHKCWERVFKPALELVLKDYEKPYEVYGAIWTNKGLIYVAKMNEKGELELL